jgi:hypothetical protein
MYSKLPLAIGIFEHQVNRITKELAEDFFKYEDEGFAEALLTSKTKQMRTIPVNISIDPEFLVGSYDNARTLIERSPGPFAVMNCVCRQGGRQGRDGHSCGTSRAGRNGSATSQCPGSWIYMLLLWLLLRGPHCSQEISQTS